MAIRPPCGDVSFLYLIKYGKKNILISRVDVKLKGFNIKYPDGKEHRNFTLATCCLPGILAATHDKRRKRMNYRAAELPYSKLFKLLPTQ